MLDARSGRDVRGLAFTRDEWLSVGEVRSAAGRVVASFSATGKPVEVALSESVVALLSELSDSSKRISVFNARTGSLRRVVRIAHAMPGGLASDGRQVLFVGRRMIRSLDLRTGEIQMLIRTRVPPIRLSVSGGRVAWAENLAPRKARIRAVTLP